MTTRFAARATFGLLALVLAVPGVAAVKSKTGTRKIAHARPGPWGDLEIDTLTLAAPDELLATRRFDPAPPLWRIPGITRAGFARKLGAFGMSEAARAAWLAPEVLREFPEGIGLAPTCPLIRGLGAGARGALFTELARHPDNAEERWEFPVRYLETFPAFGVPAATARAVEALGVRRGSFMVTYAMSCALPEESTAADRTAILRALSQQPSRTVSLRVTPRDDARKLKGYWGRGASGRAVAALLDTLIRRPGGGRVDLARILPPLPAALLNAHRAPKDTASGSGYALNCSWTALNFFRERPDSSFADANRVAQELRDEYVAVAASPRFGDVAVFLTPDRYMLHVATYVADDLYFTKNGANSLHPWVLNTAAELRDAFSFGLPSGRSLSIRYFRRKRG